MIFQDNVIKEYLKNVYFITGTAYAGKSTMIKMLSEKYESIMCEENYTSKVFKEYNVNPIDYPNLEKMGFLNLINYYSFVHGNQDRVIHPLDMFLYNSGWGCAAYCELKHDLRHFELKRINGIMGNPTLIPGTNLIIPNRIDFYMIVCYHVSKGEDI